jgi:hypothetical protein
MAMKVYGLKKEYFRKPEKGSNGLRCYPTGWSTGFYRNPETEEIFFAVMGQPPTKIEGPKLKLGDYVVVWADGIRSRYEIAKLPKDPRLAILWRFGYRKATRITDGSGDFWDQVANAFGGANEWDFNEHGIFIRDGLSRPVEVKNSDGKIMVSLYSGRVHCSDKGFCSWYMNESATLEQVKEALRKKGCDVD